MLKSMRLFLWFKRDLSSPRSNLADFWTQEYGHVQISRTFERGALNTSENEGTNR